MRLKPVMLLVTASLVVALASPAAAGAHAGKHRTTLSELESEVMCPTCGTTLQLANSPLAERQRAFILARVERNQTKEQIKAALVAEFGEQVLADPPRRGFGVAVYVVPLSTLAVVLVVVAVALRRWRRVRGIDDAGEPPSLGAGERERLDEELTRFGRI